MKTNAITIIQSALEGIGEYDPVNTITDADAERCFMELNKMMSQWSNSSLACFAFLTQNIPLVNNKAAYTIGPLSPPAAPPDIVGVRPLRLEQVYLLDNQGNKYWVTIDTLYDWNNITNGLVTSQIPTDVYYDPQDPIAIINVWPVPIEPLYTMYWTSFLQLNSFPNLAAYIEFPEGYEDAITCNLRVKICPFFGKAVTPDLRMEADETRGVIKRKNKIAQTSYYDPEIVPRAGSGFNILSGSYGNRGP